MLERWSPLATRLAQITALLAQLSLSSSVLTAESTAVVRLQGVYAIAINNHFPEGLPINQWHFSQHIAPITEVLYSPKKARLFFRGAQKIRPVLHHQLTIYRPADKASQGLRRLFLHQKKISSVSLWIPEYDAYHRQLWNKKLTLKGVTIIEYGLQNNGATERLTLSYDKHIEKGRDNVAARIVNRLACRTTLQCQ